MNTGILEKANDLMAQCNTVTLASVNENGYPRICVMEKIKSDGIKKIYTATGMIGTKTRHFQANPKASVCAWSGSNSITLIGNVVVTQERAVLEAMWVDWFINHFPGGIDDPNYCILEFSSEEATLWINGEFVVIGASEL